MAKNDPHRQRIVTDTAEWQRRLEQLAEMRRTANDAHPAAAMRSNHHDRPEHDQQVG